MIRTGLVLGSFVLAQVVPGCPLSQDDSRGVPGHGTIATTAVADVSVADAGQTVQLVATIDADPEGGEVLYNWFQLSGPGVKLQAARGANASFVAPSLPSEQVLQFRVNTRNPRGDLGNFVVAVTVRADPNFGDSGGSDGGSTRIAADAGPDQTVDPGVAVSLNGSGSSGAITVYAWSQTAGTPSVTLDGADTATATFTAPAFAAGANTFTFELEVRDDTGRSSRDSATVTVRDPDARTIVRIETTLGNIVVELEDQKSPISVANFLAYVDEGFYTDLLIHRVVKDFVIQGGGFDRNLSEKEPTHPPIRNESDNGLTNDRGTVAMARTSEIDSAQAQFFINLKDNDSLNATDGRDGYAVFGRVVEGMDVVDAIAQVRVVNKGFPPNVLENVPFDDITILRVVRVE